MDDSFSIKPIKFKANTVIFNEGDESDAAYVITDGLVEVRIGCFTESPQVLATLSKGDVLGEMALFDDNRRMATAVAVLDTTALMMSRQEFCRRVDEMDPLLKGIVLLMVKRMRLMADDIMAKKDGGIWK